MDGTGRRNLRGILACGAKPRLAMSIMLYLGVRRSDAVLIGKKHESRDGLAVTFAQFKGRKKGIKLLTLPILPPLRAILDASALGRETWLETASGKPHSSNSFGNKFKSWCVKAGIQQCNCHGLRKIGAVRAAEAGASEHELMAMFGWDDASMARVYTRKAAQKKLAASGAEKIGLTKKNVPPSVPPEGKYNKNNAIEEMWCPEEDSHWATKPLNAKREIRSRFVAYPRAYPYKIWLRGSGPVFDKRQPTLA